MTFELGSLVETYVEMLEKIFVTEIGYLKMFKVKNQKLNNMAGSILDVINLSKLPSTTLMPLKLFFL